MHSFFRCRVLTGLTVLLGSLSASAAVAQELYTLETTCRSAGTTHSCNVVASNVDDTTEYVHTFGSQTVSYRVIDDPYVRIEGRARNTKPMIRLSCSPLTTGNNVEVHSHTLPHMSTNP